jgi:thiamine-phosphate pyrophosphorylase
MFCFRSKRSATGHRPLPSAAKRTTEKSIVCYVTDGKSLTAAGRTSGRTARVLGKIRKAITAGVDWVQIREQDLSARDLLSLARQALQATAETPGANVRIILNDRVDVALAAGAAGVHLGGESLPLREVLRWQRAGHGPEDWLIGASCHSLAGACEAESSGASYIFFGPVFDTPSKRPFGPPQGVAKLAEVCRAVRIPVIAIGGVNRSNGDDCLRAGAAGVAAIRLFQEPRAAAELMRTIEAWHSER